MQKKMYKTRGVWILLPVLICVAALLAYHFVHFSKQSVHVPGPQKPAITKAVPASITVQSKLLFMGDVMLARSIGQKVAAGDNPFKYVQGALDEYDFRFANVETTIADPSTGIAAAGKLFTFNAPLSAIPLLAKVPINVAGLANNHTKDFGSAALSNMLDNFQTAGIKTVGAGKNADQAFAPLVVEVPIASKGKPSKSAEHLRVAVIAANDIENSYTVATASGAGSAYFDEARIAASIKTAREVNKADVVVVVPHWGVEYDTTPSSRQVSWAHFFIDSGADIVIGSHPHVVQPMETYQGKYIVYSMGNFVFDEMSGAALDGEMIGLTVTLHIENSIRNVTLGPPIARPVHIDTQGFPEPK